MKLIVALCLVTPCLLLRAQAQEILKHQPTFGTMRPGTVVYVDNKRCPAGQVTELTAGTLGNRNGHPTPRGKRCVPRP